MNSKDYRSTLGGVRPSPAWRARTLAAMEAAKEKKHPVRRPLAVAATAAVLAVAVTGGVWLSGRTEVDPDGPGVARTPEPVVTPTPSGTPTGSLSEQFFIVTDPSQLIGSNPTAGHLYELTKLPVYENPILQGGDEAESTMRRLADSMAQSLGLTGSSCSFESTPGSSPKLTLDCSDGTQIVLDGVNHRRIHTASDPAPLLDALRYDLQNNYSNVPLPLSEETLTTYSSDGTAHTTQTTFVSDRDIFSLEEQLYQYTFRRFTLDGDTIYQTAASTGVSGAPGSLAYPLRSPDDAQAAFRAGDYWGSCCTAHPDEAQIIFVSLEYDTNPSQSYFQPVYRILFVQSYWDMADWMDDGVDPTPFMGVGVAYVPAIDPAYQDQVPYNNDALAYHTPEDLS